MTDRRRKILVPLAILGAFGAVAAWVVSNPSEPERRREEPLLPLVRVVEVAPRDVPLTVTSHGTVRPALETVLVAQVPGRIEWTAAELEAGGSFSSGLPLARIEDADYRLAVEQAEAALARARVQLQLEEAESELAREEWAELGSGDAGPLVRREPQVARARAELRAAEAGLERARLDLERTVIRAPFAGRSREPRVDVGRYVTPGTPVGEVYSSRAPEVVLPVTARDLELLALEGVAEGRGPRVEIRAPSGRGDSRWQGMVVRVGGEIDPRTRMLPLYARLSGSPATDEGPPMNLFVEARIEGIVARHVVELPRAALRDADTVLVVADGERLSHRRVEVLRAEDERVLVEAGLDPGERVCLSPLETVVDGMRVRIQDERGAAEEPS